MLDRMILLDNKFKDFLKHNFNIICIFALIILSAIIRYLLFDFISVDTDGYLLPWYDQVVEKGGVGALKNQIGDYNMPFQLLIVILYYVPIKPLYAYKIIFCLFDYVLGYAVGKAVFIITGSNRKKWLSFFLTLFSPIVLFNSACWGQSDSIYVSFCILAIVAILEDKKYLPFVFYGVALTFKLQAIFLFPFLLIIWWRSRKTTILRFFTIPLAMVLVCLPNIIIGHRNVKEIIGIYMGQTEEYGRLAMNYPSFWNLFAAQAEGDLFQMLKKVAILFTVFILLMIVIYVEKHDMEFTKENIVLLAMITVYTCVLFLPSMHERYSFMYEVIALIILMVKFDSLKALMPMYIITVLNYSNFLFAHDILRPYNFVFSIVNIYIYSYYARLMVKT